MSRQNSFFSERDDDFFDQIEDNRVKLSMVGLYEPFSENNNMNYPDTLKDSLQVAKQTINNIIKNTEDVIYEKYLNKRKDEYAIAQTLLQGELLFNMAMHIPDTEDQKDFNISELENDEPPRPIGETWIRSKISVEHLQDLKKLNPHIEGDKDDKHSQKTSLTYRHRYIHRKEDAFKGEIPQPTNMEKPQEVDDIVERLRVIKQLETKRKEEKEEQEKKDKQKNPQENKKEMKNNKYTYDFDGKIINTKVIKTDKLPPSNYSINYQFSTQEVDRNKMKKMKAQQEEIQKQLQLQLQQQQQMQQKGKGSFLNLPNGNTQKDKEDQTLGMNNKQQVLMPAKNPFSYEDFNPTIGVTLYYDQRIKEGPRNKEQFESLANLDQRLKLKNEPVQITRTEYKRLTENGNLNMAATIKNMQDYQNQHGFSGVSSRQISNQQQNRSSTQLNDKDIKRQDSIKLINSSNLNNNNILDSLSNNKTTKQSYFLSQLNHPHINAKGQKDDQILLSLEKTKNKITINQPKLIGKVIINDEEFQINTERGPDRDKLKLPQINDKMNTTMPSKSPVDDFNQSIIKGNADWGKGNKGMGVLYQGKTIHKPDQNLFRKTLNQQYKLPRERDWGQSFKTTKSVKHVQSKTEGSSILQPETEFRGTFYTFNSKFSDTLRSFKNQN